MAASLYKDYLIVSTATYHNGTLEPWVLISWREDRRQQVHREFIRKRFKDASTAQSFALKAAEKWVDKRVGVDTNASHQEPPLLPESPPHRATAPRRVLTIILSTKCRALLIEHSRLGSSARQCLEKAKKTATDQYTVTCSSQDAEDFLVSANLHFPERNHEVERAVFLGGF